AIRASASARSAAPSVPNTYSPARPTISSSFGIEAFLESDETPPEQRLDRRYRAIEARCEFFAAPALVIGEKHHLLPLIGQSVETALQSTETLRLLRERQRIGPIIGNGGIGLLRLACEPFGKAPLEVDRQIVGDRRHPRHRWNNRRII